MYPKASPFSLALAMLVRDQVLSLLSELKFLKKKKDQNQDEATASSCLMLATALCYVLTKELCGIRLADFANNGTILDFTHETWRLCIAI